MSVRLDGDSFEVRIRLIRHTSYFYILHILHTFGVIVLILLNDNRPKRYEHLLPA